MLCVILPVIMIDLIVLTRFRGDTILHEEWVKQYGSTLKYKGFFYVRWPFNISSAILNTVVLQGNPLFTMDTRVVISSPTAVTTKSPHRSGTTCWQGWVIPSRRFCLHTSTEDCRQPFHRRYLASPAGWYPFSLSLSTFTNPLSKQRCIMAIKSSQTYAIHMIKPTFRTLHLVQDRFGRSPTSSSQKLPGYESLIPFHADHSQYPTQLRDVLSSEIAKDLARTTAVARRDAVAK